MKDWELHLALNDPTDPIHDHIEEQLDKYHPNIKPQEEPKPEDKESK